jgi:hypothetical protein
MEISNNRLAVILLIAVIISIGGTIVSLNKLNTLGKIKTTTGLVTVNSTGTTLLNISSVTSIRFSINTVDFGAGAVNTTLGFNNCTLSINGSSTISKTGCAGFNDDNPSATDTFIIINDGNNFLNVTLNASANATDFIGGNASVVAFQYALGENESGSCSGYSVSFPGWTDVSTADPKICDNLSYQPTSNSIRVGIRIVVPANAPQGPKTATFTATGTAW